MNVSSASVAQGTVARLGAAEGCVEILETLSGSRGIATAPVVSIGRRLPESGVRKAFKIGGCYTIQLQRQKCRTRVFGKELFVEVAGE